MTKDKPETWRKIPGFTGRYEVSDRGRVKSTARWVYCTEVERRFYRGGEIATQRKDGVLRVRLKDNLGGKKTYLVSDLIKEAFNE